MTLNFAPLDGVRFDPGQFFVARLRPESSLALSAGLTDCVSWIHNIAHGNAHVFLAVRSHWQMQVKMLDFGQFDFGLLPKSNLAEVEFGRSQNWPEVRIG